MSSVSKWTTALWVVILARNGKPGPPKEGAQLVNESCCQLAAAMILPLFAGMTLVAQSVSPGLVNRTYSTSWPGAMLNIPSLEARVSQTFFVIRSWLSGSEVSAVSTPVLVKVMVGPDQTVGTARALLAKMSVTERLGTSAKKAA